VKNRWMLALILMVIGLGACDLPGAHANDAAVVNGHAIPKASWDHLVKVTTQQLKARVPIDLNSDGGKAQVRNLQAQSLRALIREELIEEFAGQRHITVTNADLDRQIAQLEGALGGAAGLNQRLDQAGESIDDVRHTIRVNLLQAKMKAASKTYQADFDKALNDAEVTAYVPPCDSDHSWPACAGGQR